MGKHYYGVLLKDSNEGIFSKDKDEIIDRMQDDGLNDELIDLEDNSEPIVLDRLLMNDLGHLRYQIQKYNLRDLISEVLVFRNDRQFNVVNDFINDDMNVQKLIGLINGKEIIVKDQYVLQDVSDKGSYFALEKHSRNKFSSMHNAIEITKDEMLNELFSNQKLNQVVFNDDEITDLRSRINGLQYFDLIDIKDLEY